MPSVTFFTSSTSTWFSSPANSLSSVRKSLRRAHARLAQPRGAEHAAHIGVAAAWEWQEHRSGSSMAVAGAWSHMQWQSCLSRMGTQGQFQKPSFASASLSS